jgi:signal transduction histidine kinase
MNYRRTPIAALLTLIAVAVPSAAWFFSGERQLEREHHLRQKGLLIKAQKRGVAEGLAARFAVLRKTEADRPFYHYQNLYHDPEGASEGLSVTVSPLAKGSPNPLIEAYFQVDDDGRLTLPTINDDFPELGVPSTDSAHCSLLEELSDVTYFCLGELDLDSPFHTGIASDGESGGAARDVQSREVALPADAWRQNLEANAIYGEITYSRASEAASDRDRAVQGGGEVRFTVGPFLWHTLPVGDLLGLVALRKVETPVGEWTQGFLISQETVRELLAPSPFPATFLPMSEVDRSPRSGRMVRAVEGIPWVVAFDISGSLNEVLRETEDDRERFYAFFLIGAISALAAGLLVVAMVYQSERLALQRAQFAASAAHELRTPLAGLRLYGEMLADGLGNPKKSRHYARRMAAEAERLGRVVTNVLSFTRFERKSLSVHPEPGDLVDAVNAAFQRQAPALAEAGVEIEVDLADDLPPVVFDRDAVDHIVQNLLDNAEKYTRGRARRKVEIRVGTSESGVELSVADTGPGIPKEMQGRLFRPFARGGKHDAEGLGLGLVLVKALANAQGGDIRYRDRPSGGAEFTVSFAR